MKKVKSRYLINRKYRKFLKSQNDQSFNRPKTTNVFLTAPSTTMYDDESRLKDTYFNNMFIKTAIEE